MNDLELGMKAGEELAWKTARKLFLELSEDEAKHIFNDVWHEDGYFTIAMMNPHEIRKRIEIWEKEQRAWYEERFHYQFGEILKTFREDDLVNDEVMFIRDIDGKTFEAVSFTKHEVKRGIEYDYYYKTGKRVKTE